MNTVPTATTSSSLGPPKHSGWVGVCSALSGAPPNHAGMGMSVAMAVRYQAIRPTQGGRPTAISP